MIEEIHLQTEQDLDWELSRCLHQEEKIYVVTDIFQFQQANRFGLEVICSHVLKEYVI